MSGLAIASLVQSGVELHWTPRDQTVQAGLILIAVPFVLQLLACILSYMARDGATGAAVGVLATSWLAIGLIHIAAKPGATSGTLGLLLVSAGGVLLASASAIASDETAARGDLRRGGAAVRDGRRLPAEHRSPSGSTPPDSWACSSPRSPPTRRWRSNSRANASGQCCPHSAAGGPQQQYAMAREATGTVSSPNRACAKPHDRTEPVLHSASASSTPSRRQQNDRNRAMTGHNRLSVALIGARALVGVALLARPRALLAAVSGQDPNENVIIYARVLGARHLMRGSDSVAMDHTDRRAHRGRRGRDPRRQRGRTGQNPPPPSPRDPQRRLRQHVCAFLAPHSRAESMMDGHRWPPPSEPNAADTRALQVRQGVSQSPSRATPASEICGARIRGPCIHFERGVCAGRHGDGRIVGGGMHGCGEERDWFEGRVETRISARAGIRGLA